MKSVQVHASLGKEYKTGGFRRGFYSLPAKSLKEAREEICKLCYWSRTTFQTKLSGKAIFRIYEVQQIENYFASKNIDAWTGNNIIKS